MTSSLRRNRPFLVLCADQMAGSVGRQITAVALPLTAVVRLHAGPFGASALMALSFLPGAVLSPFVGLVVDRARLRRLLVVVLTVAQGLLVAAVPVADASGWLSWPLLYAVALGSGTFATSLTVALQAALPRAVGADQLLDANVGLSGARTAGQIGGPALGGLFVAWFGTSQALLGDSVAFGVEAVLLCFLPAALNVAGERGLEREPWLRGVREGLRVIAEDQVLRRQVTAAGALNFGGAVTGGFFVFYATEQLGLSSWQLGVTFAVFAAASALGVVTAKRVAEGFGLAEAVRYCAVGAAAALFLMPAAALGMPFETLIVYQLAFGLLATVWAIAMTTARQLAAPPHLQGRVAAFQQAAVTGAIPAGALLGGFAAGRVGIVPVQVAGAAVALAGAGTLWLPRRGEQRAGGRWRGVGRRPGPAVRGRQAADR
ncbi:MFS family permease [Catenulispora sp. GP43]|uniref:MFS transporter n=1 Tax=Catenulispora sp. GP43 TaxID=3156263 RepID=UPI0035197C43